LVTPCQSDQPTRAERTTPRITQADGAHVAVERVDEHAGPRSVRQGPRLGGGLTVIRRVEALTAEPGGSSSRARCVDELDAVAVEHND
jgi:hypothetical protein